MTINRPDPAVVRQRTRVSLRSGIERDYTGQVSRDVVRLLQASENPGELIWEAIAYGAPRAEFGWGHSIASATDCLSMVDLYEGDRRALPIVQGIAGIAESERDRPVNSLPAPSHEADATAAAFRVAVEAEEIRRAQGLVLAAIERGDDATDLRPWFTAVVSDHHLSYGHGAIYTQKAFELLDMLGWDRAATVLPHLVPTLIYGTREDKLPYMRPFMKALGGVDLDALADLESVSGWVDDGSLRATLLGHDRGAAVGAVVAALRAGAGVDGVLDTVIHTVSDRMLRYDTDGEFDFADDFGWLDITHGLTYAAATRWHHDRTVAEEGRPSADMVRLAMYTAFLAQWTGRHEWHTGVGRRTRGRAARARPRDVWRRVAAHLAAGRNLGVHRPRPRGQDESGSVGRGGADGFAPPARCHGPVHVRAEARALRGRHGRTVDRLPQRPHPTRLNASRSCIGARHRRMTSPTSLVRVPTPPPGAGALPVVSCRIGRPASRPERPVSRWQRRSA